MRWPKGFDPIALGSDVVEGRRKAQAKLQGELFALLRAHGYQSERIGNLSTKLRLTNQSRWSGRKADQQARRFRGRPEALAGLGRRLNGWRRGDWRSLRRSAEA